MADSFAYGEKGNSLGIAESRVHARTEVRALAYIELSDENAGLILNISEDGLAVQAVQVVTSEYLPRLRFRLPKTDRTIEVAGRMVWQLRSRKELGIQFVDISDDARAHIREWIGAEPSRLASPPEPSKRRALQAEKPSPPHPVESEPAVSTPAIELETEAPPEPIVGVASGSIPLSPTASDSPPPDASSTPPLPEVPPSPEEFVRPPAELPDTLPQPGSGSFPPGRMSVPDLRRVDPPPVRVVLPNVIPDTGPNLLAWKAPAAPGVTREFKQPRRWWIYAAALGIIVVLGFATWMIIDPGGISTSPVATVSPAPDATTAPSSPSPQQPSPKGGSDTAAVQQTPQKRPALANSGNASRGQSSVSQPSYSPPTSQARPPVIVNPLAPANSLASREASTRGGSAKPGQDQSERQASSSVPTAPPSQMQTLQSQTVAPTAGVNQQQAPAPAVPSNLPPVSGSQTAAPQKDQDAYAASAKREQEASAAANQSKPPVQSTVEVPGAQGSPVVPSVPLSGIPSGSVGATSQFHAIRIPPALRTKGAQLGGNLQIGQMLSSYSPSYPIDAARQGVEGIVKLDAIVAPDGTVESVQVLSGPAMLTGVSVAAVKQWRYGQTLLGGQPIGAEQYVTLVFRLGK